ncbi:MAG: hypothetical protein EVA65_15680 [Oceanococcus sp.]|nr:MAG: hypothetical protein EVA65_15680 [Oceanococcus sp.]
MASEQLIDFAPDTLDDILFKEAKTGIEAERFLESRVGRHVRDKAVRAYNDYVNASLDATGGPNERVEKLRMEAQRARDALNWLVGAVVAGEQAQKMLLERDAHE